MRCFLPVDKHVRKQDPGELRLDILVAEAVDKVESPFVQLSLDFKMQESRIGVEVVELRHRRLK